MKQNVYQQSFWIYALTFCIAIGAYATRVLLTRSFSPTEFGLFYAVIGFVTIISVFNDLGLSETLKYFGIKWYEEKKHRKLKFLLYLTLGVQVGTALIIAAILFIFQEFLLTTFFKVSLSYKPFFTVLLVYFVIFNVLKTLYGFATIHEKYEASSIQNFIFRFALVAGIVFILIPNPSLYSLSLIWTSIFFVTTVGFAAYLLPKFHFLKRTKIQFSKTITKNIFKYAIQVMIGSSVILLMTRIDILIITYFLGVTQVGYYEVALALATIMAIVIQPISQLLFPLTTKYMEHNQKDKLNHFLQILYRIYFVFTILAGLTFFLFSKEIITIMFGVRYLVVLPTFLVLTIGTFFHLFSSLHYAIMGGLGQVHERNKTIFLAGFLNIVLNLALVHTLGIFGVGLATVATFMTMFFATYVKVKTFGIKPIESSKVFMKQLVWLVIGAAGFSLTTVLLKAFTWQFIVFAPSTIITLILQSVITITLSSCAYLFIIWYGRVIRFYPLASHLSKHIAKKIPKWL